MSAHHDRFNGQLRTRLQVTCMALGLVRLLQDAGLNAEARETLASLENDCSRTEPRQVRTPRKGLKPSASFSLTA